MEPGVVQRLQGTAERYRRALGDERLGLVGEEVRPIGRVEQPSTLTTYDPNHPYFMAEYDLAEKG
jgi:hypothetical protein